MLLKRRDKRPDGCLVHLSHPLARAADQVDVLGVVLSKVVGRRPVMKVTVLNQAKLFEQLQRAVHGGGVDAASSLLDFAVNFFRRGVLQPRDRLQN